MSNDLIRDVTVSRAVMIGIACVLPLRIADAQKPLELNGHENVISALTFNQEGDRLYSGSWDKTVRVWDTTNGKNVSVLRGHSDWVFDLSLPESANQTLVSVSQNELIVRAASLEEKSRISKLGGATVNSAAIAPNSKWLALGGRDGFVRVRSVATTDPPIAIGGFRSWVSAVCLSSDGKLLAAGTRTGTIRFFELPSKKQLHSIDAHPGRQVLALAMSPDGTTVASGAFEQAAKLWTVKTGKESAKLSGHRGVVTALTWSADGRLLATGERHGSVHIWDTANANGQLAKFTAHSDGRLGFSVTALAFSRDGKRIASGSYDKTVKIWTIPKK